jgi:proline iminopeptidase
MVNQNIMKKTGFVESGGFQLGYEIEGKGPNALVIGSAIYYPRIFSPHLRKHLRMIFVDHRGFANGPQTISQEEYELDVVLDDIEKVRQELGLGKVIIMGHSGHGFMALEYAKKYPHNVSHVVNIAISPDLSPTSHQAADQYFRELATSERIAFLEENLKYLADEIQADPEKRFLKFAIRNGPRTWFDYQFNAAPLWEGIHVNMPIIDHLWGVVFRDIDITHGLDKLDVPVFLALGRYDFLVAPASSWVPFLPHFKDLTLEIFEQSGHNPPYEEPDLFDTELLRWLAEHQ